MDIKYCTYFSSTKPLRRGEYIVEIEQDQDYCGVATKINFKTSKRRSLGYFRRIKYSCTYNEDSYDSDNDEWNDDYNSDSETDYDYQNYNSNSRSKPLCAYDGKIIWSFTWSNVGRKITSIIIQKAPRKLAPKDKKEISLFNYFRDAHYSEMMKYYLKITNSKYGLGWKLDDACNVAHSIFLKNIAESFLCKIAPNAFDSDDVMDSLYKNRKLRMAEQFNKEIFV